MPTPVEFVISELLPLLLFQLGFFCSIWHVIGKF